MMDGNGLHLGACFAFAHDGSSAWNFGMGPALEQKNRLRMRMATLGVNVTCLEEALLAGESKSSDEGPLVEIEGGIVSNGLVLGEDGGSRDHQRFGRHDSEQERGGRDNRQLHDAYRAEISSTEKWKEISLAT